MPIAPKKPCAYPLCPALVDRKARYCESHQQQEHKRVDAFRASAAKRGYGRRWQRLRKLILARDPICKACNSSLSTDVDHITPKSAGGLDTPDNLQGLCHACHSRKTATQDSRFASAMTPK